MRTFFPGWSNGSRRRSPTNWPARWAGWGPAASRRPPPAMTAGPLWTSAWQTLRPRPRPGRLFSLRLSCLGWPCLAAVVLTARGWPDLTGSWRLAETVPERPATEYSAYLNTISTNNEKYQIWWVRENNNIKFVGNVGIKNLQYL